MQDVDPSLGAVLQMRWALLALVLRGHDAFASMGLMPSKHLGSCLQKHCDTLQVHALAELL